MSENIIGTIGAEEVEEVAEAHFYESLLSRLTDESACADSAGVTWVKKEES